MRLLPFDDSRRIVRAVSDGSRPGAPDDLTALEECAIDIMLRKGRRSRVFRIAVDHGWAIARASVSYGIREHRRVLTADVRRLTAVRAEFAREIAQLREDGWT